MPSPLLIRPWLIRASLFALALFAGPAIAAPTMATAIFAGGCFWTMEHGLEEVPGVVSAVSGFTGGPEKNPTYQQVASERTGHVEAVKVTYDPAKISYRQLLDRYWRLTDPTDLGGQACDRGKSYQPAVFVASAAERKIAEASKAAIDSGPRKGRVATPIRNAAPFWPADAYHQDFAKRNPAYYERYRVGCGRDKILQKLWGGASSVGHSVSP
ncbi:MAG TPA: peptide-methionine (S)-S-oxide reductase MsrA [Caulobacterales bacterium]|nr:peptide-methionine (S)-S-oxide reductase MsrA [Caulobacterales bacterium]